jgi:hypothetical protein
MNRRIALAPKQLMLTLQREPIQHLSAEVREELIKALADLLLEALGEESHEQEGVKGSGHESED